MEGLADFWVRQSLTDVGNYDWCVTEFVRVNGTLLPPRVFYRWCPELKTGSHTRSGIPVHVQLLGSDPVCLAENAHRAVELGAPAIDLNFGCPAKTVNRHRGGAVLLDEPEQVHAIVSSVRRALPDRIPVSAKMRLGNNNTDNMLDNALAVETAGASWLTVHGRTRLQGYRPPAYWQEIGRISETVKIPVIANGEIWTPEDAALCVAQSGCSRLMLGRGAVADPFLVNRIRRQEASDWQDVSRLLECFLADISGSGTPVHESGRFKQWLSYLKRRWPEAEVLLEQVKRVSEPGVIVALLGEQEKIPCRPDSLRMAYKGQ